jgi:hypothetical protein
MSQDWDIKSRSPACRDCGSAFVDNAPCFSVLEFTEEGYARGDYCATCWGTRGESPQAVSTWQSLFRAPAPKAEEPLKQETAESLLRRLMEDENESNLNVIYILAVMLERKKILVERDVKKREDGGTLRIYEHRKSGETFVIREPELRLDQLEGVQTEVIAMLGKTPKSGDGTPGTPAAAAPQESEPAGETAPEASA